LSVTPPGPIFSVPSSSRSWPPHPQRKPAAEIRNTEFGTRRFIGCGGSMMAAPMLPHLWEWLDLWRHDKAIDP
jgi:hypothetical protein